MKISGIYKIQSKIKSERIYIGSAVNINKRWWNHLSDLRKKKHPSRILQNHFNKYGETDLQFSILLGCNEEDLIKIEQYFMDSYNPFFNVLKIAGRGGGMKDKHHSKETIEQMKKSHKGCKAWNKGSKGLMVSWNKTPILQYDRNDNFIKEWDCAMYAEKEMKIRNINRCAIGERKTAGGYIWKYKNVS